MAGLQSGLELEHQSNQRELTQIDQQTIHVFAYFIINYSWKGNCCLKLEAMSPNVLVYKEVLWWRVVGLLSNSNNYLWPENVVT